MITSYEELKLLREFFKKMHYGQIKLILKDTNKSRETFCALYNLNQEIKEILQEQEL